MMRTFILLSLLLFASTRGVAGQDELARARQMAFNKQRPEAIAMLRKHLETSPNDVDARLFLGTMLSWDGSYDEARTHLETVLERSPTYLDAMAALVNVELWSDHPRRAFELARRGLSLAANDDRFIQARRRAIDAIELLRAWRVAASYSYDWFGDGRDAWKESSAMLKRGTPVGPIIARGSRAERFGLVDHQVELEMYPRLWPRAYGLVSGGYAPDHRLYARSRFAADIYQGIGAGFEASVGIRRLNFSTSTNIYVGALNKYVGSWLLTGKLYYIPDRTGASSKSYHGSFRRYFGGDGTSYVGARYSRGFSREELRDEHDFEVLNSDTIALETELNSARWIFTASGSTSKQDRLERLALRQHSVSAGLGIKF